MSEAPAPGGAGDDLKQEAFRRFKKLSLQFVVSKLTDDRLEAELNELHTKQLLPDYFNVNETFTHAKLDGVHTTFLHLATETSRPRIVQWLLQNKADPNARNTKNETPLHIAVAHAKKKAGKDVISALVESGGRLEEANGEGQSVSALAEASGVDLNKILHKDEEQETKSAASASVNNTEATKSTEQKEASKAQESDNKELSSEAKAANAAKLAADNAKTLIKNIRLGKIKLGAIAKTLAPATQPDSSSEDRVNLETSVIQTLSDPKTFSMVHPAIDHPILDGDKTLLHLAAECGFPLLTNVLLKLGLDPNKQDSSGFTSLHACTTSHNYDPLVAHLLIADSRTNVNIKSYMKQETAFAAAGDKPHVAELQAIEVNKNFKMQTLRALSQLNDKRKPVHECVKKILELKNSKGQDASSESTEASTQAATATSSKAPSGLLERLARRTSASEMRRQEALPYGRPAPSSQFGELVTLGPSKNPKYGADYRPPTPPPSSKRESVVSTRSSASGKVLRQAKARPGSSGEVAAPASMSSAMNRSIGKSVMPTTASAMPSHKRGPSNVNLVGQSKEHASTTSGAPLSFLQRMALRQAAVDKGESSSLATARISGTDMEDKSLESPVNAAHILSAEGQTVDGVPLDEARQKKLSEVSHSASTLSTALLVSAGPAIKKALTTGASLQRAAALRSSGVTGRNPVLGASKLSSTKGNVRQPGVAAGAGMTNSNNENVTVISEAMLREAYSAINPGSNPLPSEIVKAAIQAKGVPSARNMKELLEFVTLAVMRMESMKWDFGALDFHYGQTAPVFGNRGGLSAPPFSSPYSAGSVPSSAFELVTSQSSLERSGAIFESKALRDAGARLDTQFGFLGDESGRSVLWNQAVQIGLAPEDVTKELSGLGF